MSPALAAWIRDHGQRLADFPSAVYRTVQLWYVPASPYDPVADIVDIADGVFINVIGSDCGGYTVTDGATGAFYSGYQALGGKGVVGEPLSRVTGAGGSGHEQLFDGAVLASAAGSQEVHPMPVVAMMARRFPAAYQRAGLPPVPAGAEDPAETDAHLQRLDAFRADTFDAKTLAGGAAANAHLAARGAIRMARFYGGRRPGAHARPARQGRGAAP